MSINPRSQPYRLDPPVTESNLPQIVTNADEMFQILFEEIGALDTAIDDVLSAVDNSGDTGIVGPMGPPGMDGIAGDPWQWATAGDTLQDFVPYVGATKNVDLGSKTLTTPTVIGGTAIGSSLALQSTSGVGTTDFIKFAVGNAGATEAMRVLDSGIVLIGTTTANLFPIATNFPALEVESLISGTQATIRVGASIGANSASFVIAGNRAIDLQNFASIRAVNSATGAEANVADITFSKDGSAADTATLIKFDVDNGTTKATRVIIGGTKLVVNTNTLFVNFTNARVGIGTITPSSPLNIVCDTAALGLNINGRASDNQGFIQFFRNDGTTLEGGFHGTTTGMAFFGPSGSDMFTFTNTTAVCTGSIQGTDFFSTGANGYRVAAAAYVYWNGRAAIASNADSQLRFTNGADNTGVGIDVATDGTLKVRTRAQTADGKLSALFTPPAGTATAGTAPLKFTSGTNLTTAEAGAVEYNGTNLFFTRAGTVRENVLVAIDNVAAPGTGVGVAIVNFYGASATNYLGDPNRWLSVNVLGTIYKIPLYT